MQLSSTANARIKNIKRLDKASERREQGRCVVEGLRELCLADRAGYKIEEIYLCPSRLRESLHYKLTDLRLDGTTWYELTEEVYSHIAYRDTTEGVMGLVHTREHSLSSLKLPDKPLILVIEGVEKPGNLGAMLRTADAAGVDAIILNDTATDIYNPNVIRASIGTVFTTPIAIAGVEETIVFMREAGVTTFAATLGSSVDYRSVDLRQGSAIVVGTEADGLTAQWTHGADYRVQIPMRGAIDSLNVSVSSAIMLYEAVRQRG